ncbi:crossover junction endonuclease EME1 isoform X2 [Onthophagus taurus]|uniref:crossover junction endonuclease EME1 isoform X2 n=1 Tax=Onthophagus taurus TaxID=166361 RepID=UPI0039BEAB0C
MEEDYESAKKLLEELRKKYCPDTSKDKKKKEKDESDKNAQLYSDLKEKYSFGPLTSSTTQKGEQKSNKIKSKSKLKQSSSKSNEGDIRKISITIDSNVINKFGQDILGKLQDAEIFSKITTQDQLFPGLITWEYSPALIDDDKDINDVILILNWDELLSHIKSSNLLNYISSIQDILTNKTIYLGLLGIDDYFKYWKSQKAAQRTVSEYQDSIQVTRNELEMALTELQLANNCCYRNLNSSQDLIDLVLQYTKSIVQLPEKLEKSNKYKDYDFNILKVKKDSVSVDKDGNGLQRLWQHQLTMFEMARLETAEAIVGKFPTPSALYEACKDLSKDEGHKLIEEIPIRRAAGPHISTKKVGPKLSSKVYTFFNSINGDDVL